MLTVTHDHNESIINFPSEYFRRKNLRKKRLIKVIVINFTPYFSYGDQKIREEF